MTLLMLGDWEQLGIEPTHDIEVIRRAYALRLRQTRPDDDAEAYQQLRSAYDRVLALAQSTALDVSPKAPEHSPSKEALQRFIIDVDVLPSADSESKQTRQTRQTRRARQSPSRAESAEPETFRPSAPLPDTVERLIADWSASDDGFDGLAQSWPGIAARLSRLPFASHDHASLTFADLVINSPHLPSTALVEIRDHFDWRRDYRIERLLGLARAANLHRALDAMPPLPITDLAVLHRFRHIISLARLLSRDALIRAVLLSALIGAPIRRLVTKTDPALLSRLGMSTAINGEVFRAWAFGAVLRAVAWLACLGMAGKCLGASSQEISKGISGAISLLVVMAMAGTVIEKMHPHRDVLWMGGLSRWWVAHLGRIDMQIAGIVMVVIGAASLAPASIDAPRLLAGVGLSVFGTLCAWPDEIEDGELFLAIGAMLWSTGWGLFGFAWCLLAASTPVRVSVERAMPMLPRSIPGTGRGLLTSLRRCAGLILAVAVLPSLAMAVARRMGAGLVIGALAFTMSLRQMRSALPADGASFLLVALVVLIAFVLLQVAAVRAVDAVFRRSERFKS